MITVGYKITKMFFNPGTVADAADRKRKGILSKAGAFIRRAARSSIRRRKAVSAPGGPPSAHSTDSVATIKNILFGWDPSTKSVVVGPVALNIKHSLNGGSLEGGTVPQVLEHGGTLGILEIQHRDGSWSRADLRSRRRIAERPQRVRRAHYAARPFMGPALRKELPKFPQLMKNSIVSGG
jgi:hypothetical protein